MGDEFFQFTWYLMDLFAFPVKFSSLFGMGWEMGTEAILSHDRGTILLSRKG